MNYGFAIDTRSCIGCHACSTACKSENQVPLGVNRTWVKYTESGRYPDVTRNFQVTRCNHCSNPPCVRICPVTAMYQRDDGIVEFDSDVCIGCKACMQACPYDAIYIDPATSTAAKCHFCAHRVEVGMEPACVVVCPTHSIIAGDLDDPQSEISRVVAKNSVTVRKPEQGTAPKLFYVEGDATAMHPTATERPEGMMFSEVVDIHDFTPRHEVVLDIPGLDEVVKGTASSGATIRIAEAQGEPVGGPIQIGQGRMAEHMVQVAYNAQHKVPWHWQVPAYLVTKSLGTGGFLILIMALMQRGAGIPARDMAISGLAALLMTVATTGLLVADLERPERFLRIIFRPQWKSWLTRGAFILIAFSTIATAWTGLEMFSWLSDGEPMFRLGLTVLTAPLAIGAAIYTAFLFGQCEGRDLWQSPMLPLHLLIQSITMGGALLVGVGAVVDLHPLIMNTAYAALLGGLIIDLFVLLVGELAMPHASEVAAQAAHKIRKGRFAKLFWGGAIIAGHALPIFLLIFFPSPLAAAIAAVLAIGGLYAWEHAFVMAPQEVPNS